MIGLLAGFFEQVAAEMQVGFIAKQGGFIEQPGLFFQVYLRLACLDLVISLPQSQIADGLHLLGVNVVLDPVSIDLNTIGGFHTQLFQNYIAFSCNGALYLLVSESVSRQLPGGCLDIVTCRSGAGNAHNEDKRIQS